MLTGLLRFPRLHRYPDLLLVPCAALAITAAGMLLISFIVAGYACYVALTHGGTIDPERMNEFGRATGPRLGPAICLALAFLVARWLVAERRLGYGSGMVLAVLMSALGAGIGWTFGQPPAAGDAALGLVYCGATGLGGWLGKRDLAASTARERLLDALRGAGSLQAVTRAIADHAGPGCEVDIYEREPTLRWLAGSAGGPPAHLPPAEALVACGPGGQAIAVRSDVRPRHLPGVADAIGVQLQRLALRAEGESAGALAERERLAGDIHDTMAQSLAAVTTHLEAADSALAQRAADAAQHLRAARASARTALAELRGLVWALRPAGERMKLDVALQRCADRVALESGLPIELELELTGAAFSPEVELCLLRATQEGLRNAVQHGAPGRIAVTLAQDGDRIVLTIEDDGTGFDPAAPPPVGPDHGHGLRAMSRRVERLGGEQEIVSGPGRGTRLVVRLPLPPGQGSTGQCT